MKKINLLVLVFFTTLAYAQNSVPNGNFELLDTTHISYPTQFEFNSITGESHYNINKTTGYTGDYGVELKTIMEGGEPEIAFIVNGSPESDDPNTWHGGIPYSETPTGLQGHYKYNVESGDKGMVVVAFSRNGVNIETYFHYLDGLHTEYTPFNFTFIPALSEVPDSVFIGFISSDMLLNNEAKAGSTLIVDNVSFVGATTQPELLNGDFELWTDENIERITDWYGQRNEYLSKTENGSTDAFEGNYAIVLRTLSDNYDGEINVYPDRAMTGYWDNCDENQCELKGGFLFTNQTDKLEFYYKYKPSGNDTAQVRLYFPDNGGFTSHFMIAEDLLPAEEYTFMSVPFDIPFEPTTVVIEFISSVWGYLSSENIGSELKVDAVSFLSSKTSVQNIKNNGISVFPNPAKNGFYIPKGFDVEKISIFDLSGRLIFTAFSPNNYVDISHLDKGVYLLELEEKNRKTVEKLIIE